MRGYILLLLLVLALPLAAADQVVINSGDWQDVYSSIIYARLKDFDVHYVAEETQGIQLIGEVLNKDLSEVLLIESKNEPSIFGYESKLEENGFKVKKFLSMGGQETNLELAENIVKEKNIDKFIIVDGKLGYDAVSVAPYALLTNAFVLFADSANKEDVIDFLKGNAKEILLYGHLDREIKEELTVLNPEIINTGDRYNDNIELVKKFLEKSPTKQVFLTHGEVLELGFFNSEFPLLFVGISNVPDNVIDFIKDSDIRVGVVIGYDLFVNAKKIREETGIKILLKYGQGRNSQLYALDIVPLPSYSPSIGIKNIRYNTISKQLEVIYENTGEVYTYVQTLSHDISVDGISIARLGDEEPFFLNVDDVETILYDIDLFDYLNEDILVESKVIFGESTNSLTKLLTEEIMVEIVAAKDNSQIEISGVEYNEKKKRFEVAIKNIGEDIVYADPEVVGIIIDGEKLTFGAEQQKIEHGKKSIFEIKTSLEEVDFEDNQKIKVHVRYGAHKDVLLKSLTQEFDFVVKGHNYKPIILIVVVLVLIMLIISLRRK